MFLISNYGDVAKSNQTSFRVVQAQNENAQNQDPDAAEINKHFPDIDEDEDEDFE